MLLASAATGAHLYIERPARISTPIYTAVFNDPQPPVVSTPTVPVETGCCPCETEFRIVLGGQMRRPSRRDRHCGGGATAETAESGRRMTYVITSPCMDELNQMWPGASDYWLPRISVAVPENMFAGACTSDTSRSSSWFAASPRSWRTDSWMANIPYMPVCV